MNYASNREQIQIYVGKFWRNFRNDKGWIAFLGAIAIPLIACLVVGGDVFSSDKATKMGAFILVCSCIWIGIFNSVTVVCKERDIIKHEYRQGMSLSAYIWAHMIFQAFISLVEALLVSFIVFFIYHRNINALSNSGIPIFRYIGFFITFFLIIYSSDALGILLSSIVKSVETGMMLMPFVLLLQFIFAGNIALNNILLHMISQFMISKSAYDALLRLSNIQEKLGSSVGMKIFDQTFPLIFSWLLLIVFTLVYAFIASKILKSVENDQRS